jgi:uracil-DNA glycosylase
MFSASNGPLKRKADNLPTSSPSDTKKPKTDASITSFFGAPKSTSASTKPAGAAQNGLSSSASATVMFDKEKWVAKLTPEQKSLLKLEIDTLDESWLAHLKEEILTPGFLDLKRFLKREIDSGKKVFPPMEEVYSWLAGASILPFSLFLSLIMLLTSQVKAYSSPDRPRCRPGPRSLPQS